MVDGREPTEILERVQKGTLIVVFAILLAMFALILSLFQVELWLELWCRLLLAGGLGGILLVLVTIGISEDLIGLTFIIGQIGIFLASSVPGVGQLRISAWLNEWPLINVFSIVVYVIATALWIVSYLDLGKLRTSTIDSVRRFKGRLQP